MKCRVHILEGAEEDLYDIYNYIAVNDSPTKAEEFIDQLEKTCLDLAISPLRGRIPPELQHIGIFQYRELIFKTYRIIYTVQDKNVEVHCVLDGRRDLQYLLSQRLWR